MNLLLLTCFIVRIKPFVGLSLTIVSPDSPGDGDEDGSSSGSGDGGNWPPFDTLVSLVADRHTRYVLSYLESESESVADLDELVDRVAEREEAAGLATNSEERRRRVAIALHHERLPRLDDAALVDYDARSNTVRYWGDDRLPAALDAIDALDSEL